ncbi:hypothetical protein Avbf_02471 [Armadillidium vulgare]|nr:hypothetical protein Avbf_02471 [Armadillidium vulgare]
MLRNIRLKWSYSRKEREEKLQAVLTTVKTQLEDSYDVTLSSQEEYLSLDQQYDDMMSELASAFEAANY